MKSDLAHDLSIKLLDAAKVLSKLSRSDYLSIDESKEALTAIIGLLPAMGNSILNIPATHIHTVPLTVLRDFNQILQSLLIIRSSVNSSPANTPDQSK